MGKEWMNPSLLNSDDLTQLILYLRHKKAYEYAFEYIKGKKVLEIGCGSGFGSRMMAEAALSLTAVDRDGDALQTAGKNAKAGNIKFVKQDVMDGLPFDKSTFDVVILFQVIEHIDPRDSEYFLMEIRRVLKPDGKLLLTTPNRHTRLQPFQKPINQYHKIEYTHRTLSRRLASIFPHTRIMSLRALPEIERIELTRARSTPFNAYIRRPVRRLMCKFIQLDKISSKIKPDSSDSKEPDSITDAPKNQIYSTQDFYFEDRNFKRAIDLYAVCQTKNNKN